MEHAGKDNKLHMLKHMPQSGHPSVLQTILEYLRKDITAANKKKYTGSPPGQKAPTFIKHT